MKENFLLNLQIRKMNLQDLEAIEKNLESDFDDFWNVSIFKQELINENSYYLVALIDDQIVGFAGYMIILDEIDITNIVVRKDMRNKGIATKLLKELLKPFNDISKSETITLEINKNNSSAITLINNSKIKTITLEVNENNLPAITLYENFGFEKVGLRKNYYDNHENAIIMTKKLYSLN